MIVRKLFCFAATEVASSKKHNPSNSLPVKVRSFAKKMDDASMYIFYAQMYMRNHPLSKCFAIIKLPYSISTSTGRMNYESSIFFLDNIKHNQFVLFLGQVYGHLITQSISADILT